MLGNDRVRAQVGLDLALMNSDRGKPPPRHGYHIVCGTAVFLCLAGSYVNTPTPPKFYGAQLYLEPGWDVDTYWITEWLPEHLATSEMQHFGRQVCPFFEMPMAEVYEQLRQDGVPWKKARELTELLA